MNLKKILYWWITTVLVTSSAIASEATNTLSLEDAQRLAVDRSRQLIGEDAAVYASREMAISAAQNPDPVLRLGIENLPVDGSDSFSISRDFMTMRRIGVMQELTRDAKRQLRGERYEREADKGLAQKSETLANIQRNTALAWLDRYYAEVMVSLMAEQIKQMQLEINASESAYRAGRGTQTDLLAMRAERVALEDRASELNLKLRNAKTSLARWVGDAAETPLADKPLTDKVPLQHHTLETQLSNHPEIDVLQKQEALAATEAKLAQANKQSDWSVEVAYSQRGSQYSNMVSVGVSIPLQWDQKNRQNREVAAKLAMADQAHAEREEMLREHVAEVGAMINEWESTKERQDRVQHELLPLTTERTAAVMSAYRGGKASLNEVLSARRNETEVKLQEVQLEKEAARLWAQLTFLIPNTGKPEPTNTISNKEVQ
ncbi:MAG TPA: TolC family protein [Methylophilaceae bacterium]